ncbi:MAG: hypothetical protein IT514_12280 [Burkholderiales bacterium]|jgi:hypothetical protein|nr:hypothetical protein [Burkholderiales bacterium]
MTQLLNLLLVTGLTVLSGIMDARGFYYAPLAWPHGRLDGRYALLAIGCFVGGLSLYILAVRYMQHVGVGSVAVQSAVWFVVTAVGIAVLDGTVVHWTRAQQIVGALVFVGLAWLIASTRATSA